MRARLRVLYSQHIMYMLSRRHGENLTCSGERKTPELEMLLVQESGPSAVAAALPAAGLVQLPARSSADHVIATRLSERKERQRAAQSACRHETAPRCLRPEVGAWTEAAAAMTVLLAAMR